jgi:predicted alpha/beta-fold hydrolase
LDLRGAGAGLTLARGRYNAGCSGDVRAAVAAIHRAAPQAPIWLAGISLGANVILKLAGESSADPVPGLARIVAVSPPVDLAACLLRLSLPRNRFYDCQFVLGLLFEARRRERSFPDQRLPPMPRPLTLGHFDEFVTAPRGGFRDAADYYTQSSSAQFVPAIRLPTLILTARDDPFIDPNPIERLSRPVCVQLWMTDHGGHVGFLGADGVGGWCWGERAVADWLCGF